MLAQFALLVFAIFGVLALIVDVGFVRISQGRMQTAAEVAALEGLRQRDPNAANVSAFADDCARRTASGRMVRWVFDDDLDPANGDTLQQGAGPAIVVSDGVTDLHGLSSLSVPDTPVYKPDLQVNQGNAIHGDMVSGRFCYNDDPASSEGAEYDEATVCTQPQQLDGAYARNDFVPNPTSPQPPQVVPGCPAADSGVQAPAGGQGTLRAGNDDAFLVRMRRSNEFSDEQDQVEPDVASSGPSLPLLFGRATTIQADDPTASYSIRRDGITVRAAAIARARPAVRFRQGGTGILALSDACLRTATVVPLRAQLVAQGRLLLSAGQAVAAPCTPGVEVGQLVQANSATRIGSPIQPNANGTCPQPQGADFAARYATVPPTGTRRIIGFSPVTITCQTVRLPAGRGAFVIVTFANISIPASRVASAAGSAVLDGSLFTGLTPVEVTQVVDRNLMQNGMPPYPAALAPVLAR